MTHALAEEVINSTFMSEVIKKAVQTLTAAEWTSRAVPSKVTDRLTMFAFKMALRVGEMPTNAPNIEQPYWQQALHNETRELLNKQPSFTALFEEAIKAVQLCGVLVDFPKIFNNVLEVLTMAGSATRLKKANVDLACLSL